MTLQESGNARLRELNSADDLADLVHAVGFIPLFSNAVKGFSVEELTRGSAWWTGDPDTDPWEWRKMLAVDPDIAYGKFFGRNAGFVDKDFFPVFANYRRNGYDYDALYEDGLASHRSKKIMDVFGLDEEACGSELMTPEIRAKAGFARENGEKNYEGAITDLQMQTYLITGDFRRRTNRFGQEYGWHIAVLETPETKWGYKFIASGYEEEPTESWERIVSRVKAVCPDASDADIRKIMGIRYPGESAVRVSAKPKETPTPKQVRPQKLPWPENLITEIGLEKVFGSDTYTPLNDDQMHGLEFAMDSLKDKEQTALLLRYKDHMTLNDTGEQFSLSRERIRQILAKGIRKLRHPDRLKYIRDGLQGTVRKMEEDKRRIRESIEKNGVMETLHLIGLEDCGFSIRAYNCLKRAGLTTLGEVADKVAGDPAFIVRIRSLGMKSLIEVVDKLESYGVDCDPVRKESIIIYGDRNTLVKRSSI